MKTAILLSLILSCVTAWAKPTLVSRITHTPEGRPYLEVDGRPMVYNAVQAWKAPAPEFLMEGGYPDNMNKAPWIQS